MPFDPSLRPLNAIEARVLGTLMEKARTVPDSYPLSVNALVLGCNQKTSRDPVMEVSDDQAQAALDALRLLSLVFEGSGGRVTRYEHNFQRTVGVSEQHAVLLGLLLLRGPQTPAELRTAGERWYKFADTGSVELFLTELAAPPTQGGLGRDPDKGPPLVVLLPRAPGAREQRWMHLLCGPVASKPAFFDENAADAQYPRHFAATNNAAPELSVAHTYSGLQARLEALEGRVAALQAANDLLVSQLKQQLGLDVTQATED